MDFEFDLNKSNSNKKKHGIDFYEAQAIWDDPEHLQIPVRSMDEIRYLVIGIIGNKHWSAVITNRNRKVRLISVRRSRTEEVNLYECESS